MLYAGLMICLLVAYRRAKSATPTFGVESADVDAENFEAWLTAESVRSATFEARLHLFTQVRLVLLYDEIGRSGRYMFRDHLEQWMQLLYAHDPRKNGYHCYTVSGMRPPTFHPRAPRVFRPHGAVPGAVPMNDTLTRVTKYPISIRRMTVSILSSPISLAHIPYRYPG